MKWKGLMLRLFIMVVMMYPAAHYAEGADTSEDVRRAMEELWRRGNCLGCVERDAKKVAQAPTDIGDVKIVSGRVLSGSNRVRCYLVGEENIWLGTDDQLYQVSVGEKKLSRTFTVGDGLPDSPIEELVLDGDALWVITREGLGVISIPTGQVVGEGMPKFNVAKVMPEEKYVWVVADTGTFRLNRKLATWERLAPLPLSGKARSVISRGFWYVYWKAESRRFIQKAFLDQGSIWVISLGSLYRFDCKELKWDKVLDSAWEVQRDERKLWILSTEGVVRYDKSSGKRSTFRASDGLCQGMLSSLLVTDDDVFVVAKPDQQGKGGGISRFDKEKGKWFSYPEIDGRRANFVTFIGKTQGEVWAATRVYDKVVTKFLHPGMAHVKKQLPHVTGLAVHRYRRETGTWETIVGKTPKNQKRMILGHRGTKREDVVGPELITDLTALGREILCVFWMMPEDYYAGYYPTVERFAVRLQGKWGFSMEDYASQLGLIGEQPEVMLLSRNHGKHTVVAEGHYDVLGLEHAGEAAWVITQGGLAYYPDRQGRWGKVVTVPYRFYWGVTAAAADAKSVWFGSDRGLLARFDRKSRRWSIPFRFAGRKVVKLAVDKRGLLWARTAPFEKGNLPEVLKSIPEINSKGLAVFDGENWRERSGQMPSQREGERYLWKIKQGNFLFRSDRETGREKKVAYLKGVYQPSVLTVDDKGDALWIKTYDGVVRTELSEL